MDAVLEKLAQLSVKDRKSPIRCKQYNFTPTPSVSVPLLSYNVQEYAFKEKDYLPIYARGLFIRKDTGKICVRGYDKFFNINEVPETKWDYLGKETTGPYELTLKENGCIIYITSILGHVLVTSKHAFGPRDEKDGKPSHSDKGEEWLDKHLKAASCSRQELSAFLEKHDVTAVFELADDDFEEHVLEYPPDKRGLYCHGLNYNTVEFKSMPTLKVHEFANKFGFPAVKLILKDTAQEVREFGEECAKKGSYEGSPIEGFVVRCHKQTLDGKAMHFFKIKFEEPYLMFREWREVTRSVIASRPIRKPRFGLTQKYIQWAQAKYRQKPHLFRDFNEGKGIIALRNLFLQEVEGITNFIGAEVIALCRIPPVIEDGELDKGKEKTLLIPIATIASGKTTLARCLTILFPELIGHIQNDNIQVKRSAPFFEQQIMETFMIRDIVFADRNNHLFQHRDGLSNAFKAEYPAGKIVALDWNIGFLEKKFVMDLTAARIEKRGENHQTLTPKRVKNYKTVIGSFVMRRDEIDLENDADSSINDVITLDIQASVVENLDTILVGLGLDSKVTKQDIKEALVKAESHIEVNTKVVKNGLGTGSKKRKLPAFYGVKLMPNFFEQLEAGLKSVNREDVFHSISKAKGANREWHMTIVYRAAKDHALLKKYDAEYMEGIVEDGQEMLLETKLSLTSSRVVMNDRIIALEIEESIPRHVPSINKYRHITLVILNEKAKAMESNALIERLHLGGPDSKSIASFPLKLHIDGEVLAFI